MTSKRTRETTKPCPLCGGRSRDGHLCAKCTQQTAQRLGDLPGLWVLLQQQITRQSGVRREIVIAPSKPEPVESETLPPHLRSSHGVVNLGEPLPLPYDAAASDVASKVLRGVTTQDGVQSGIVGWVRITVDEMGAPYPRKGVTDMCEHLARCLPGLRKRADSDQFADDVWAWVDAIAMAVDLSRQPGRAQVGRCPQVVDGEACSGVVWAMLPREEDSTRPETTPPPFARCDTCTSEWPTSEWRRLSEVMAARHAGRERSRLLAAEVIR